MKKAFDQTFRDIKREVNKKVLKVPSIEQKVLDATSNEPWGPHGSLLADIAQASKNYHEYQMIMAVIWKRINDTGKNWRHVYKALTVLEYLVANGSERVIDEIREHSYQIQTLSDFQYIDSSGRDQGNNVRKKSQSLVVLVNDKERITEARQKAATNREKYRNTTGGMYRPGSYPNAGGYGGYDDDRYEGPYGGKDEDRNGHGREREWGNRDDVYGRYGDTYGRDADKYGRDHEDRYSRDGSRDDDYRGRSQSIDSSQYSSRSRSSDRYRDRGYEDDGQYSSRGSGARADDQTQDGSTAGKRLERKYSEQNLGAPPSYEEATGVSRSPTHSEQGRDLPPPSAPRSSSPPTNSSPVQSVTGVAPVTDPASPPTSALSPPTAAASAPAPPVQSSPAPETKDVDSFDEFDPRGSFPAVPATSHASGLNDLGAGEMDLLGSLSDSFPTNSLALVPAASAAVETDASANSTSGPTLASSAPNQIFDDPFGDAPFKAIPSTDSLPAQPQDFPSVSSSHQSFNQSSEGAQLTFPEGQQDFNSSGDAFPLATYTSPSATNVQHPVNMQFSQQESSTLSPEIDILADILPFTGGPPFADSPASYPPPTGQPLPQVGFPPQDVQTVSDMGIPSQPELASTPASFPTQSGQPVGLTSSPAQPRQPPEQANFQSQPRQLVPQNFYAQMNQPAPLAGFPAQAGQPSHAGFPSQTSQPSSVGGFQSQMVIPTQPGFHSQSHQNATSYGSYNPHQGSTGPVVTQMTSQVSSSPNSQNNSVNFLPQISSSAPASSHMNLLSPRNAPGVSQSVTSTALATVPQPGKDKFETKSTVWADTLSRGLVNLNISGPKINPLADIGVDFDAINRKEKRMEKPTTAPVTSTITMGKAMGSGSGIGRAGAGVMRPAQNPMMGSGMNMGMGMGMGASGGPSMGIGAGAGAGARPGMNMGGGAGPGINMGGGAGPGMIMGAGAGPGMNMGPGAGPGMNMGGGAVPGMSVGAGPGMGMGGYGSMVNQPMGMNMNNPNMGMGMGQAGQMQRPMGYPPPGGYNPMMGPGNYSQQPYGGGGYR